MIAKNNRFQGHNSVGRVRGKPLRFRGAVVYSASSNRPNSRAAIVVSKKVSKSAVVRNRIRRRFYESLRNTHILNSTAPRVDIVVVVQDVRFATCAPHEITEITSRIAAVSPEQRRAESGER